MSDSKKPPVFFTFFVGFVWPPLVGYHSSGFKLLEVAAALLLVIIGVIVIHAWNLFVAQQTGVFSKESLAGYFVFCAMALALDFWSGNFSFSGSYSLGYDQDALSNFSFQRTAFGGR